MIGLARDLVHATRRLMRHPGFAVAAVATLALAIGANTAMFSLVHRIVLNPLPYPDANELVSVDHGVPGMNIPSGAGISAAIYRLYADRSRTLNGIAIYWALEQTISGAGEPERIRVAITSSTLASVLRVSPIRGRWFTESESVPGAQPVAVLSYGLWQRRYGQDPNIVGRTIQLNSAPTIVVGVMPASYTFPDAGVAAWTPIIDPPTSAFALAFNYIGVGRLRRGATVESVRAELNALIRDLPQARPNDPVARAIASGTRSTAVSLHDAVVGTISGTLWILFGAVTIVLLIACANVANLFLVHSDGRQREVAVRRALGAGTSAIARSFLAEAFTLSVIGAALGLMLAWLVDSLLVRVGPARLPRLQEVRLDAVTVVFAIGLSVVVTALFGCIPWLRLTPLARAINEVGRGNTASRTRQRTRFVLMAGQIALALVLLVCSALMIRSFQQLRAIDPGFNASSALAFRIGLPLRDYPDRKSMVAAHKAIIDRLAALPGVRSVATANCLPLNEDGYCYGNALTVEGRPTDAREVRPIVALRAMSSGFIDTLGIRLLRGRTVTPAEIERDDASVVINEALAKAYFPNEDPIGKRITIALPAADRLWLTIVGVVSNTPARFLAEAVPVPKMYMPMFAGRNFGPLPDVMSYVIRTSASPLALIAPVRSVIREFDPNLAVAQVQTLQDRLDRASAQAAFTMALLAVAAGVALLLGIVGIYGVVSYVVVQRTGEIGVRIALGAEPRRVVAMIVRESGVVAIIGVAVGLIVALATGRLLQSLLYGITPRDPLTLATTTGVLLLVAAIACWLPARRAATIDPITALRAE